MKKRPNTDTDSRGIKISTYRRLFALVCCMCVVVGLISSLVILHAKKANETAHTIPQVEETDGSKEKAPVKTIAPGKVENPETGEIMDAEEMNATLISELEKKEHTEERTGWKTLYNSDVTNPVNVYGSQLGKNAPWLHEENKIKDVPDIYERIKECTDKLFTFYSWQDKEKRTDLGDCVKPGVGFETLWILDGFKKEPYWHEKATDYSRTWVDGTLQWMTYRAYDGSHNILAQVEVTRTFYRDADLSLEDKSRYAVRSRGGSYAYLTRWEKNGAGVWQLAGITDNGTK